MTRPASPKRQRKLSPLARDINKVARELVGIKTKLARITGESDTMERELQVLRKWREATLKECEASGTSIVEELHLDRPADCHYQGPRSCYDCEAGKAAACEQYKAGPNPRAHHRTLSVPLSVIAGPAAIRADDARANEADMELNPIYTGRDGHSVFRNEAPLDIEPSLKLWNHSPTGFSWGYFGSGPAQLALALLLDATGDAELAVRHHQSFKSQLVSKWAAEWVITAPEIRRWVKEHGNY